MSLWHIQRIDGNTTTSSGALCTGGTVPTKITLFDSENNTIQELQVCFDTASSHPCDLMDLIRAAGYFPGDWDDECPGP